MRVSKRDVLVFLLGMIAAAVIVSLTACQAVAHTAGLYTVEDARLDRAAQAKVDREQTQALLEVHAGVETPAGATQRVDNVIEEGDRKFGTRTAPPAGFDLESLIALAIAALSGGGAFMAHRKAARVGRSLQETDEWIERDIEPKVKTA